MLDYLPLIEKIFETKENIELFSQVAERLKLFKLVNDWDDWDNLEEFITSTQIRNGFDNHWGKAYKKTKSS